MHKVEVTHEKPEKFVDKVYTEQFSLMNAALEGTRAHIYHRSVFTCSLHTTVSRPYEQRLTSFHCIASWNLMKTAGSSKSDKKVHVEFI